LLERHSVLVSIFGEKEDVSQKSLNRIISLYQAWDKPEKVKEYQALLQDTKVGT